MSAHMVCCLCVKGTSSKNKNRCYFDCTGCDLFYVAGFTTTPARDELLFGLKVTNSWPKKSKVFTRLIC
jgi:hypothetical protein